MGVWLSFYQPQNIKTMKMRLNTMVNYCLQNIVHNWLVNYQHLAISWLTVHQYFWAECWPVDCQPMLSTMPARLLNGPFVGWLYHFPCYAHLLVGPCFSLYFPIAIFWEIPLPTSSPLSSCRVPNPTTSGFHLPVSFYLIIYMNL